MGTRHEIKMIVDGQVKVCQYGQWDGYPTGQGEGIAVFLQKNIVGKPRNLAALRKKTKALRFMDKAEIDKINEKIKAEGLQEIWQNKWPWLSRDCGSDILAHIYYGTATELIKSDEEENKKWCEYFYVIDLDRQTVQVNGRKRVPFAEWTPEKMKRLK